MPLSSRLIFTLIGVTLPIAAHTADMNKTHVYNPHWPPHAKFHNGQTLSMSLLLGGLTIFLAWWPSNNVPAMVARQPVFHLANHRDSISQYGLLRSRIQAAVSPGVPLAVVIDVVYLSAIVVAS
jgi:hypothetical protein